jgi:hypothetical protein
MLMPTRSTPKAVDFASLRQQLGLGAEAPLLDLARYRLPQGLRLVVESERGVPQQNLLAHLQQVYGEVHLERAFPHYEPGIDIPSLQDYYFATIAGLDADHLLVNPFDIAYAAVKKGLVKGAEPELPPLEADAPCHDPFAQTHENFHWSLEVMNVGTAWNRLAAAGKNRGGGIRIGHADTGITFHRQMLNPTQFDLANSFDFVRNTAGAFDPLPPRTSFNARGDVPGHGTMTSSVLIALDATTDQSSLSGMAPDATVVPTRVTRSVVIAPFGPLAQGINHAWQHSCNIISISLGGVAGRITYTAVRNCYSRGMLICCAAGQCQPFVLFPAILHEAIACGGTRLREHGSTRAESYWTPSSDGPIDIAAPAEMVRVAVADTSSHDSNMGITHAGTPSDPFDAINSEEGTSFATAAVAGIGALWLKFHEDKDLVGRYRHRRPLNDVFRQLLKETARQPHGWRHTSWGPGIIDAGALLDAPLPPTGPQLSDVDYLMQHDQGDDLEIWCRRYWDQPRAAVIRVLSRLLQAVDEADLRQKLHLFNLEMTWLIQQSAEQGTALRQAIAAEATAAADQVAAAATSLAEHASNKLRALLR